MLDQKEKNKFEYKSYRAFVQTLTWNRDSHGLFDFETINVDRKTINLKNSSFICRNINSINIAPESCSSEERTGSLAFLNLQQCIDQKMKLSYILAAIPIFEMKKLISSG